MQNSDAFSDALLDAAASSTFKDHDNGFGEFIRFRCCTNSFHERSGCSWSIAPPPRRSRPDHVRRIDEKHYRSLTDPIGVTLDQREATPFWGTSGMGTWTRLAGSPSAPARPDRRRTFRETILRVSPLDPEVHR